MEDWELIFEPGAVVVVDIWAGPSHEDAAQLEAERYELAESLMQACARESDVKALLTEIGVSEDKAAVLAPRIWDEMEALQQRQPPPSKPLPHRLP
jgi:hypothetical protein